MPEERKVLIKLRNGDEPIFTVNGIEEFHQLVEEVSKLWSTWLYVGSEAALRKKDIIAMYYLSESYAVSGDF
jgi:hypothetical protein